MSDIRIEDCADPLPDYAKPMKPFRVDGDGDVVDANGWLVCCPAYGVWPNDDDHRAAICAALNKSL